MCKARVPLEGFEDTKCCIKGKHPGEDHQSDAWGPTIRWANNEQQVAA